MKSKFAVEFLASKHWALEGDFLDRMVSVAQREQFDPIEALEAKSGRKYGSLTENRDGVALIHVNGVVSRYANLFHSICGGVSTELLAKEFNQALNDSSIKAIVLNIDSPGGEASGIHELSEMIYSSRSKKPIHAYVGGDGCSAAYWIATACDRVILDATARVGSIGTVVSVVKREEKDGSKTYEFVSSQSPNKRLDIESEAGQKAIQTQLDDMSDVFIDRVSRNMGVSKDTVLNKFGRGGVVIGKSAVSVGMAHELGNLEGVLTALSKKSPSQGFGQSSSHESYQSSNIVEFSDTSPEGIMSALKAQFPDVIQSLVNQQIETVGASEALEMAETAQLPMYAKKIASMSLNDASHFLTQASALRDTLSASGLDESFADLVGMIENPAALVGMAIHEARAFNDESSDSQRHIVTNEPTRSAGIDPTDIYQRRGAR